jgi:hypothetical protein
MKKFMIFSFLILIFLVSCDLESLKHEDEEADDSFDIFDKCDCNEIIDDVDDDVLDVVDDNEVVEVSLLDENIVADFQNRIPSKSAFFDGGSENYEKEMDGAGVPLKDGKYHPSHIAQYVIDLFCEHLNDPDDNEKIEKISNSARWLFDNLEEYENFSFWLFYDIPGYMVEMPWASSLTNSWGTIALIYAAYLLPDKNEEYMRSAIRALNYTFIPMEKGGGLGFWENGTIWFEEYPNIENPNHVLNGYLFSLDVMFIIKDLISDQNLVNNLKIGFESLEKNILEFDAWYGSYYDYYGKNNKIGMAYHDLHWKQLAWAYYKTDIEIFHEISKRWFEAQNQKVQSVEASSTIDSSHGSEKLNDGIYWYEYWSSKAPVEIILSFEEYQTVYGVNVFYFKDKEHQTIEFYFKDKSGTNKKINESNLKVINYGYNITGNHETVVIPFKFLEKIETDEIKIIIKESRESGIIAIREIGVMKDMTAEFEKRYHELILKNEWYMTGKLF